MRYSKAIPCAFSLLALCGRGSAADNSTTCPPSIEVRQQLDKPVAGWSPLQDELPQQLSGVTFYDGAPQEQASLVYDDMKTVGGKQIATWRLGSQGDRPTWIACSYAGTTIQLTKSLPPAITVCEVTYDSRQSVAGLPLIEKVACK